VSGSTVRKAWKGEAHPTVTDLLRDLVEGRDPRLHELDASAEVFGMPPSSRVQLVVAIATPTQAYGCLCLGGGERAALSSAQEWLVHQLRPGWPTPMKGRCGGGGSRRDNGQHHFFRPVPN